MNSLFILIGHHSAYISTTRKVERKYVDPKTMKTFEYEDGSVYTGEASKYDVFEGQGSYDCGAVGEYTGRSFPPEDGHHHAVKTKPSS